MAYAKTVVGAHLFVFINGQLFGQATSISWESQTPLKTIMGIDSLIPYELANVGTKVSGRISMLRVRADGGLQARGIVAPFAFLEREKYASILVMDRVSQMPVFRADNFKVSSEQWNAAARGRLDGAFQFEALNWSNETEYT